VTRPLRPCIPKPNRRRALELLAGCRDGYTESLMLAHGLQMVELRITEAGGGRWQSDETHRLPGNAKSYPNPFF